MWWGEEVMTWTLLFHVLVPSLQRLSCTLRLSLCAQSCPTLCHPQGSLPGASVPGIPQARILEGVAISSSRHEWVPITHHRADPGHPTPPQGPSGLKGRKAFLEPLASGQALWAPGSQPRLLPTPGRSHLSSSSCWASRAVLPSTRLQRSA